MFRFIILNRYYAEFRENNQNSLLPVFMKKNSIRCHLGIKKLRMLLKFLLLFKIQGKGLEYDYQFWDEQHLTQVNQKKHPTILITTLFTV